MADKKKIWRKILHIFRFLKQEVFDDLRHILKLREIEIRYDFHNFKRFCLLYLVVLSELLGSLKIIQLATPHYIENTEKYILLCRSTISKLFFNFLMKM